MRTRLYLRLPVVGFFAAALVTGSAVGARGNTPPGQGTGAITPIQHLVVIFQENVSFDHYFATYPLAENPPGEPAFTPSLETPSINGLNEPLLAPNNPNSAQPFRLDRSQAATADQDHDYGPEQAAADGGLMDLFPLKVGTPGPPPVRT